MTLINFLSFNFGFLVLLLTSRSRGIISIEGNGKPAVKIIKTESGDVYDCMDFYEQPAFKHPSLKNHSFYPEMRPSSRPKGLTSNTFKLGATASFFKFKDEGCPSGTVPIRRISKEDLIEAASLSNTLVSSLRMLSTSSAGNSELGIYRAIVQTKAKRGTIHFYNGVGAHLSVWNPSPIQGDQYSASQFLIQNGFDSIQVGWHVNPTLYKDNATHFFIHTSTASGSNCFNTNCPGFVIVRSDFAPGVQLTDISTRGGPVYKVIFIVYQDKTFGNWWLASGPDIKPIGFWPKSIFSGLTNPGNYIACGGETYSSPNNPSGGPPMGTGDFVKGPGYNLWDAYCLRFVTVDGNNTIVDVRGTEEYSDSDRYQVRDAGFFKNVGHALFFGGPGPKNK